MKLSQVISRSGLSSAAVYKDYYNGHLPAIHVGYGQWIVSNETILKWLTYRKANTGRRGTKWNLECQLWLRELTGQPPINLAELASPTIPEPQEQAASAR